MANSEANEDPNCLDTAIRSPFPPKRCHHQGGIPSDRHLEWLQTDREGCIENPWDDIDCHCVGCEPDIPATNTHRYFHECDCRHVKDEKGGERGRGRKLFRCVPSVPTLIGDPVALNKPCRCLYQSGKYFCSNQCFWQWNGPSRKY